MLLLFCFCLLPHVRFIDFVYMHIKSFTFTFFSFFFVYFSFFIFYFIFFSFLFILFVCFFVVICHRNFFFVMELVFSTWIYLPGFVFLDLSTWICFGSQCLLYNVYFYSDSNRLRTPTVAVGRMSVF